MIRTLSSAFTSCKGDRSDSFPDARGKDRSYSGDRLTLKIELEVLKIYVERYHPGFAESYPKFREEAIQSMNPEWMGSDAGKKIGL